MSELTNINHANYFKPPLNFLALPDLECQYKNAKVAIVPVPYDGTTSYRSGTRDGPMAIIQASRNVELYDHELNCEPIKGKIFTFPELEPNTSSVEQTISKLEEVIKQICNQNKLPVVLGGEHSISLAPVRALKAKYPSLSVLQLDAHADLRDEYESSIYNHACVMRRICEVISIQNIAQVGIRNISYSEAEFVKINNHFGIFYAEDIILQNSNKWIDDIISKLTDDVYITIDLDVFDSSIMPSVGTPEPGGLNWYQVLNLLKKVIYTKNIVGIDIVELCPIPGFIAPDFLTAKLLFKILAYLFVKNKW